MPTPASPLTRCAAIAAAALAAACALPLAAHAQGKELRIAHIYSKTGPLEAYGKQTATGFMMGLDYATGGTMTVAGKKLVVIEKDDQGKPDVGKNLLAQAYGVEARIGDVCVLPAEGETVWWRERGRFGMRFRGHHGGLTPEEAHTVVASLVVD